MLAQQMDRNRKINVQSRTYLIFVNVNLAFSARSSVRGILHARGNGVATMSGTEKTSGVSRLDFETAIRAPSDTMLIEAIAIGDKQAMRVLYKRYNVYVYRFIWHLIGDCHLTEDLVSNVFLKVWRHADHFRGRSTVSTWLLGISRLKALSARRRHHDATCVEHAELAGFD
jgi:hypothetical protein